MLPTRKSAHQSAIHPGTSIESGTRGLALARQIWRIAAARVPAGRDDRLPDHVFVDELIRRRPAEVSQEDLYSLVRQLAPEASAEDLKVCQASAQIRHARAVAENGQAEIAHPEKPSAHTGLDRMTGIATG